MKSLNEIIALNKEAAKKQVVKKSKPVNVLRRCNTKKKLSISNFTQF